MAEKKRRRARPYDYFDEDSREMAREEAELWGESDDEIWR